MMCGYLNENKWHSMRLRYGRCSNKTQNRYQKKLSLNLTKHHGLANSVKSVNYRLRLINDCTSSIAPASWKVGLEGKGLASTCLAACLQMTLNLSGRLIPLIYLYYYNKRSLAFCWVVGSQKCVSRGIYPQLNHTGITKFITWSSKPLPDPS